MMENNRPPIDMQRLIDLTNENVDNLRHLTDLYITETTRELELIEKAIGANNPSSICDLAHSVKGASLSCGAFALAETVAELETLGKGNMLSQASHHHRQACSQLEEIKRFIENYLKSRRDQKD